MTKVDAREARRALERAKDVLHVILAEAGHAVTEGPEQEVGDAARVLESARETLRLIEDAEKALGAP